MWVGRVVGPEESRGCADRWRGSGGGGGKRRQRQDDRRVMPSQRWVVQRAQAGGGVMTTRRRTLAIGDRSGGAGGKARHSLCKSKCSLSPRGGYWRDRKSGPPGVCVWRACSKTKQKGHEKKKQRGGGSLRGETRGWWGRGALRRLARLGALPDARRAPHGGDGVTARWGWRERREPREGSPRHWH